MKRTLVLYESKYGFTKMLAEYISLILGAATCLRLSELDNQYHDYDFIVLCAPVYCEKLDENAVNCITKNADWIKQKKVVVLCSCLAINYKIQYLKPLLEVLENNIAFSATVAGELIIEKLDESDYNLIKELSENTNFECKDYKLFDKVKFIDLVLYIKGLRDQEGKKIEENRLLQICQDFIRRHNTCTLATGYGTRVRATPGEYIFMNGFIYLLSEGGEKYANLLLNPNVSIGISNPYRNMNQVSSVQITGTAEFIREDSDEYRAVLVQKNQRNARGRMPLVTGNLLRVQINKVELQWSETRETGFDSRQILYNG